jgi:hypothetical protein
MKFNKRGIAKIFKPKVIAGLLPRSTRGMVFLDDISFWSGQSPEQVQRIRNTINSLRVNNRQREVNISITNNPYKINTLGERGAGKSFATQSILHALNKGKPIKRYRTQ